MFHFCDDKIYILERTGARNIQTHKFNYNYNVLIGFLLKFLRKN